MYVFTPEQNCLLRLSANIWRRRAAAKRHGLYFNEETATEVFLLDLAEQFPGKVKIVPFNRTKEGKIGADWAWAFVSCDGQWHRGMLVQAKRLDDREQEYPEIFYHRRARGAQTSIPQLDKLISSGKRLGLPPVCVFYNHLSDPRRVPHYACASLRMISRPLPESWGVAAASAFKVRRSKPDKSFSCHRGHSLPLHCLLCSKGTGHRHKKGSAGAAADALSRLFEEDEAESEFLPPIEPTRDLPDIFQFAERIHQARMEGDWESIGDPSGEYPEIGGVMILQDSDEGKDLGRIEHPAA